MEGKGERGEERKREEGIYLKHSTLPADAAIVHAYTWILHPLS